jgi:hypothetical protein
MPERAPKWLRLRILAKQKRKKKPLLRKRKKREKAE